MLTWLDLGMVNRTFRWDFGGKLGLARHAYFGATDFTAKCDPWLDRPKSPEDCRSVLKRYDSV